MTMIDPTNVARLILFSILCIVSAKLIHIAFRHFSHRLRHKHAQYCQHVLTTLYSNVDPYKISIDHRKQENIQGNQFLYGEIVYASFVELLDIVQPKANEIFYDLGCGAGKAVFTTALLYPDSIARGVELLTPLHDLCINLQTDLKEILQANKYFQDHSLNVEFTKGNLEEVNFSEANIVYFNVTCFDTDIWPVIAEKLESLPNNARAIIISKNLTSENFELMHQQSHLMSWGLNTVNIYRKISNKA